MYDFPLLISQQGPLGTPTPQSSPDTPGQIWITGTIFHFSFLNRAPSGLPLRKAPLIRLDPSVTHLSQFVSHFGSPAPYLARSYDEVCHARLADPKCLGELLLGKGKSKLNLRQWNVDSSR